jgi:hypothetical protein
LEDAGRVPVVAAAAVVVVAEWSCAAETQGAVNTRDDGVVKASAGYRVTATESGYEETWRGLVYSV